MKSRGTTLSPLVIEKGKNGPDPPSHRCSEPVRTSTERMQEFQALESLVASYQKLHRYLGEAPFMEMGRSYLLAEPSVVTSLPKLLQQLPVFLRKVYPYSKFPELAEFATLEFALNTACEGTSSSVFTLHDLAKVDPVKFAEAIFKIQHPLLHFKFKTNVTSLWASMRCGVIPPKPERLSSPVDVIVWRQGCSARFRILGEEEMQVLSRAVAGAPFGELCELVANQGDLETAAERAASYLRGWIDAELICSISLNSTSGLTK